MKLPGILSPGAVSGLVALAAVALYDGLAPRAPAESLPAAIKVREQRQARDVELARKDLKKFEETVASDTWTKSGDEFGPFLMREVGGWARKTGVGMVSVRPQKTERTEFAIQFNYLLTMEGSFPNLVKFVEEFETPESVLSVRTLQVTSADAETDKVRASIGVVAYAPIGGESG